MQYEILYHRDAQWLVGETKSERAARIRSATLSGTENCYRGTYSGKIISWRPVNDKRPSLKNMSDKDHLVVVLDTTSEDIIDSKIVSGQLESITFDDRFGAVAVKLREQHTDPEQWELDEIERIEKAESDNTAALADYETATEEYSALIETFAREVIDANRFDLEAPDIPEAPQLPRLVDVGESSFDREANALAKALPPTVTNTGAGLYATKETPFAHIDGIASVGGQVITLFGGGLGNTDTYLGGFVSNSTRGQIRSIIQHDDGNVELEGDISTWASFDGVSVFDAWSTIQAAADQLLTDQGAATFTANQYIRVFAGTYDENVAPNTTLNTGNTQTGIDLFIEGDPTDDRANIIIAPSGGTRTLYLTHDFLVEVRHLTIAGSPSGAGIELTGAIDQARLHDLAITVPAVGILGPGARGQDIFDCVIAITATAKPAVRLVRGTRFENCHFIGFDKSIEAVDSGFGGGAVVCIFENWQKPSENSFDRNTFYLRNCTIYNCTYGYAYRPTAAASEIINCIFHTITDVMRLDNTFPEETTTRNGGRTVFRNNIYYNYTNFANTGSATKTYAQFIALNRVDADGDLDATDPLLTNPGAGDFSLQAGSPAIHAGIGSGVIADINGDIMDPYHPPIGAVGTGIGPNVVHGS